MKAKPRLSVIVPNYNNEVYLAECLNSILRQSFKDLEIVVYDDGSSDESSAIIRDYQERNPKIVIGILDPTNRGVAQARHRAILASGGEYLTTLDSDDYYSNPLKLEKEFALVRRCLETEGKDVISFSNVLLVKEGQPDHVWGTRTTLRQGLIGPDILGRACFIPRDFLMKRDLYFRAGGYDFRFKIYEDWDLKIRLAMRNEFRYTGELGTAYRRHGRGLSLLPVEEHRRHLQQIFAKNIRSVRFFRRRKIRKTFQTYLKTQLTVQA
jgi:glycosyltransferase involved in cell wall biosynthesis